MATLLAVGGAYAMASFDWCGRWERAEPRLASAGAASGQLRAGAARVPLEPPYPVVLAGYAPPRSVASRASFPLYARAVVLQVGAESVGLVTVDLLSLPAPLADEIRARVAGLGLGELWVVATHSHTSFGGYDSRLVSELAGTGRFRDGSRAAVVEAAVQAVTAAHRALAPTALSVGEGAAPGLTSPRTGADADERLTRLELTGAGPIARLWVYSAHPTLVEGRTEALDPDWPGALAAKADAAGGVTLVVQGSVGNSTVADPSGGPEAFAARLFGAAQSVPPAPAAAPVRLGHARVILALPRPDASRLPGLPGLLRAAGDNVMCQSSPRTAEVSLLQLGPVALLAVPVEPTAASGRALEAAAHAQRVVALADGYLGYLEPAAVVAGGTGESRRQYFGPTFEAELARAAGVAAAALAATPSR